MNDDLTNLLSPLRQQRLVRDYRFRLGVVFVSLGIVLVAVAMLLLVPTYIFLAGEASAKKARLADVTSTLASSDDMALSARLAALSNEAGMLTALSNAPSPSGILRSLLAVSRPGITLSGFSYTPATNKTPGSLTVSGIAATRDALRSYQLSLQSAAFVGLAQLPVSAYAKDTDIAFTITITLVP